MRYIRTDTVPIAELRSYPGNARVHDDAALDESAKLNGQYRSIVARVMPDDALQILAGHGTLAAFKRAGDKSVRVEIIDADDTEARRIVLVDNGASRNASYDEKALLALLDKASQDDGGLLGTGWDAEAFAALVTDPQLPEEGDADRYDDENAAFSIIVECVSERQQMELLQRFDDEGLTCRAMFQ
jgi:hypothetical protein